MVAWTAATGSNGVPGPLAITANRTPRLTQNIKNASASLGVNVVRSAYFPSLVTLRYVGQSLVASDLSSKQYVDSYQSSVAVSQTWLDNQLSNFVSGIATPANVDTEIAKYATRQQVTTDQAQYFDQNVLGAASEGSAGAWTKIGLAKSDSLGKLNKLPNGATDSNLTLGYHIPNGISTDNVAKFYDGMALAQSQGTTYLTSSQTVTTNNNPREFRAAKVVIPDPGYSYYPMNFVYIQGKSGSPAGASRTTGTGNTGVVTVYSDTNSTYYAYGTCLDTDKQNWHVALPHGSQTSAPSIQPSPVKGSLSLNLYLSNYTMNNYIFYASGLTWVIILMPVVGN